MEAQVVKVGGSLLLWPGLPQSLDRWLAQWPARRWVLIAGGGPWAELVRRFDQTFSLPARTAHEAAMTTLSTTSRLLAAVLPECHWTNSWSILKEHVQQQSGHPARLVVDCSSWFSAGPYAAAAVRAVPPSWETTSDSLAAEVARALGIRQLWLLKSRSPSTRDVHQLCRTRYWDAYFSIAAAGMTVHVVNLRAEPPVTVELDLP